MKKELGLLVVLMLLVSSVVYASTVMLGWNAVADDGNDPASGPATRYDLRYSEQPILETNFEFATQLETGAPKLPGQMEMYTFTVPDGNKHFYFAIKVYDEVNNASTMSNLAEIDLFPPATVVNLHSEKQ